MIVIIAGFLENTATFFGEKGLNTWPKKYVKKCYKINQKITSDFRNQLTSHLRKSDVTVPTGMWRQMMFEMTSNDIA